MHGLQCVAIAIGLTLANFGVQFLEILPDFTTAMERSFFQAVAILTCYICGKIN